MKRGLLGWLACMLAFAAGVLTAALAAENRARGDELDRHERWCEAQSRQNDLQRVENERLEWQLVSARPDGETRPRGGGEIAP